MMMSYANYSTYFCFYIQGEKRKPGQDEDLINSADEQVKMEQVLRR